MQVHGNVVLVIDDDEINRMVAKTVLESQLSCKVVAADNGVDGIDVLRRQHVSVVLLDIEMPFMDGFQTLAEIRADEGLKDVPVIMLTAAADRETITRVAMQGVAGYIKKPFLPEDMVRRVKECLDEGRDLKSILIVDGEEEVRRQAKDIIDQALPFYVLTADSGIKALEAIRTRPVDLALMSLALPFLDGLQVASMIAMNELLRDVKILLMTDSEEGDAQVREEMEVSPMIVGCVRKPFSKETLLPPLVDAMKRA